VVYDRRGPADGVPDTQRRALRFDRAERFVHWSHAALFLMLVATGALLIWADALRSVAIGPYRVLPLAHTLLGVGLLVAPFAPLLRRRLVLGWGARFNWGQRLNLWVTVALVAVMGLTGMLLWLGRAVPFWIQEPAYEWHAFLALVMTVLFLGHLGLALASPRKLRAMVTGWLEGPPR
jgi:cytochrome b subunit of formate dehydrogenase